MAFEPTAIALLKKPGSNPVALTLN